MKKNAIITCAFLFAIGLLSALAPTFLISALIILIGIEAVVNGLYGFIFVRRLAADNTFQYIIIVRSMISIIVGLLAVFLPLKVGEAVWSVLLVVVGVYLIVGSFMQLFAIGLLRDSDINRKQFIFESLISIAVAIVMFVLLANIKNVVRIIGGILMLVAIADFVFQWLNRPIIAEKVEVVDDVTEDNTSKE